MFSTIESTEDAELNGLTHDAIVAQEWEVLYYTVLICTVLYCIVLICTILYCTVCY